MGSCWSSEESSAAQGVLRAFRRNKRTRVVILRWGDLLDDMILQIDAFEQAIQRNSSVSILSLGVSSSTCFVHDERYYRLCRALGGLQNLSNLTIELSGHPEQDYQTLISILQRAQKARYLTISFFPDRHGRVENEEFLRLPFQGQGLAELEEVRFSNPSSHHDFAVVQDILSVCHNLQKLTISGLRASCSPPTVMTQMLRQPSIQNIRLYDFKLCRAPGDLQNLNDLWIQLSGHPKKDCQTMISILQNGQKVRCIAIDFKENGDSLELSSPEQTARLQTVFQSLVELEEMKIESVSSHHHFDFIQEFLPSCQNLRKLTISGRAGGTSCPSSTMSQILKPSLREVMLEDLSFDESCCLGMASVLANETSCVERLALLNCNFDDYSVFFHGLSQSSSLKYLGLAPLFSSDSHVWSDYCFECLGNLLATNVLTELAFGLPTDTPSLAPVLRGVATSGTLRKLTVAVPKFNETLSEAFGCALSCNPGLHELEVYGSMKFASFLKLLQFMPVNQNLKGIRLHNRVRLKETIEASLPDDYKQNFTMQKIEFSSRQDDALFCHTLRVITTLNKAGRRYLVEDAGSRIKGAEVLIEVRDDLDCLFTHLVENPSLCDIVNDGSE